MVHYLFKLYIQFHKAKQSVNNICMYYQTHVCISAYTPNDKHVLLSIAVFNERFVLYLYMTDGHYYAFRAVACGILLH